MLLRPRAQAASARARRRIERSLGTVLMGIGAPILVAARI